MLFRIEDSMNIKGQHREYGIPIDDLPILKKKELDGYIAEEIRKEINNSKERRLLSYSKSLGVCLLKFNKFTDNEIHINYKDFPGYVRYWNYDMGGINEEIYDLEWINLGLGLSNKPKMIKLCNFCIDVSNNSLVEEYLKKMTGVSRKKVASPEKDKEVLLFQSPDDIIITEYTDAVYLLYALAIRFGIKKCIYHNLIDRIQMMDDYYFACCCSDEREGMLYLIDYLYNNLAIEKEMSYQIIRDSYKDDMLLVYYDPITQFHDIQIQSFEETYSLGYYNGNIISDIILECYAEKYL